MQYFARPLIAAMLLVAAVAAGAQTKSKAPIVIGQTYVESGPLASLSAEPLVGVRAMVQAVNAAGGINGRLLELRLADDGYDAERAAGNVRQFAQEGAVAILMPIGTTSTVGALKAANELKVPLVGPYTGAAPAVKFSEFGFPVRISFDEEYGRIVNHLFTLGITRIAFAHNDNPGARSAMEATRGFIEKRGHKMLGSVAIKQDGSDAADKARELAALQPSAVVLSATNGVAARFIPAFRAAGAQAKFYSFSFLNGQALHKALGEEAAGVVISQVVPYPWNDAMPVIAQYRAAMKAMGTRELGYGSLEGYVNAKVLVDALKRAGPQPTAESVKKALESFKSHNLGGIYVRYSPTEHAGLTFSELSLIKKDGGYAR
jgi:branched-chain amino acid transport system substrate-binding protein